MCEGERESKDFPKDTPEAGDFGHLLGGQLGGCWGQG